MFHGPLGRTIRLGITNLKLHLLRSILTGLGILFGVAAVILMLAITEGKSETALRQFRELGSNTIVIVTKKPPEMEEEQQSASFFSVQDYGIEYADCDAIVKTLPAVKVVVPVRSIPKLARRGPRTASVPVFGTVPGYDGIAGLVLREGRFLARRDLERKNNYAVLGAKIARTLFPFETPVGKTIRLGTESFRVVGVLSSPDQASSSQAATLAADAVLVPVSAARAFFGETTTKTTGGAREIEAIELHTVRIEVEGTQEELNANVLATARALRTLMKGRHKKKEDYQIIVPLELLQQQEEQARNWQIVLGFIAGISLVIGGIGIMNVMLATVTERTREIGIRRALGAKRKHIVAQFLVETIVLSCGGGLAGVLVGVGGATLIDYARDDVEAIIRWEFALLAFSVSALVGMVFGVYPAWRAAQMDPVEALRHE